MFFVFFKVIFNGEAKMTENYYYGTNNWDTVDSFVISRLTLKKETR